jgi:hypothetical protein
MVKAGNNEIPRVQPLFSNVSHNVEHYGNLVTYFRMKNLAPPSTKRGRFVAAYRKGNG